MRNSVGRRRLAAWATACAALLVVAGCTASSGSAVTVTSNVTLSTSTASATTAATGATSSTSTAETTGSSPGGTTSVSSGSTTAVQATTSGSTSASAATNPGLTGLKPYPAPAGTVVKTEPDGFQITKIKKGQTPPQFIVYSFDGVGWDEKWKYWFDVASKVPFHFTGFLSGIYLLTSSNANLYTGPGHGVGKSSIGFGDPGSVPTEIGNLNRALGEGEEIGTHFNGHFCDDNPPGGDQWNTADWNSELDQFFSFVKNVDSNNHITTKFDLTAAEIKGERTPCLTGHKEDLYPALESHGLTYDSSFGEIGRGLAWPTKSSDGKIWEMGMVEYPLHGSGKPIITMDYNFFANQEPTNSPSNPPAQAKSQADGAQVLATYEDMYKAATTDGIDEPLILGNHFENWNNNAYTEALHSFALEECGKANTYCVPFRDLIDWMQAQDPAVLKSLQNHRSNLGGCPYTAWPNCQGKIKYTD